MPSDHRYLVTGASGALGAWCVKHLLDDGIDVVALVPAGGDRRLRLIASPTQLADFRRVETTPADLEDLRSAMDGVTHVIHTDLLTDDEFERDPVGSAASCLAEMDNVLTVCSENDVAGLAFESSMSVFSMNESPVAAFAVPYPTTPFGSLQHAKELLAQRRLSDVGLSSVGARVQLAYGPGQDMGLRGTATRAIASAVKDEPYEMDFKGLADFQFIGDVAAWLIAAARLPLNGAEIVNLEGEQATLAQFAQMVAASTGTDPVPLDDVEFPMAVGLPGTGGGLGLETKLETTLDVGIRSTLEVLRWSARDLY